MHSMNIHFTKYWIDLIYLTLLKLGAPSVCGASFASLSMPSKWSVIALAAAMSAILLLSFLYKHE